ncbi:Peptide methionine sulfoxide reductase MsrA [Nitrospira japonica]|uniref:Peptide methionine sulfoxide reductase MsrA n=1 Tax=Nitrospira japonica TaxID=1325564 RepID=A0A1W1I2U3_9BACT|nr:peptide-methionine (S)-S-oxide reductase MsrA [Nitrospira japonica]SLM47143.1 Peptide methionine sulfoxide reductase MsrA [Nitrospira japonica]
MRRISRIFILLAVIQTSFGALMSPLSAAPNTPPVAAAKAYFAGGCFWSMERAFEKIDGVSGAVSGFMGGTVKDPSYEEVSTGQTGHMESVEVRYDSSKVTYAQLLDVFWKNIDPLTTDAQFCDHGPQYRTAVFYQSEEEKRLAEDSKRALEQSNRFTSPIVTQVLHVSEFFAAEEYHQDFYKKNPVRYRFYNSTCGRTQRLEALWGPAS